MIRVTHPRACRRVPSLRGRSLPLFARREPRGESRRAACRRSSSRRADPCGSPWSTPCEQQTAVASLSGESNRQQSRCSRLSGVRSYEQARRLEARAAGSGFEGRDGWTRTLKCTYTRSPTAGRRASALSTRFTSMTRMPLGSSTPGALPPFESETVSSGCSSRRKQQQQRATAAAASNRSSSEQPQQQQAPQQPSPPPPLAESANFELGTARVGGWG